MHSVGNSLKLTPRRLNPLTGGRDALSLAESGVGSGSSSSSIGNTNGLSINTLGVSAPGVVANTTTNDFLSPLGSGRLQPMSISGTSYHSYRYNILSSSLLSSLKYPHLLSLSSSILLSSVLSSSFILSSLLRFVVPAVASGCYDRIRSSLPSIQRT